MKLESGEVANVQGESIQPPASVSNSISGQGNYDSLDSCESLCDTDSNAAAADIARMLLEFLVRLHVYIAGD